MTRPYPISEIPATKLSRDRFLRALHQRRIPTYKLAQLAGISEHRVYRALLARMTLRPDELEAIAKTLGVLPEDLLEPAPAVDNEHKGGAK